LGKELLTEQIKTQLQKTEPGKETYNTAKREAEVGGFNYAGF